MLIVVVCAYCVQRTTQRRCTVRIFVVSTSHADKRTLELIHSLPGNPLQVKPTTMSSTIDTNIQPRNGRRFSLFSSQKVGVVDEVEVHRPKDKSPSPKQNPQRRRKSLVDALNHLACKLDLEDEVVDSSDDEAETEARLKVASRQQSVPNKQQRRSSLPLSLGNNMPSIRRMSSGGVAMNSSSTKAADYKRTITSSTADMTSDDDRAFEPTAADSAESLFDSDERFKCVDGFITLTSDSDEGGQMKQQRGHRGPIRRRSLVDLANLVVQGEKE